MAGQTYNIEVFLPDENGEPVSVGTFEWTPEAGEVRVLTVSEQPATVASEEPEGEQP